MLARLKQAGLHAQLSSCLVLPDFRVGDAHIVAISRERIIDASEYGQLGSRACELLAQGGDHNSDPDALRRFLENVFQVAIDLRVLGDHVRRTSRRLAEGLATWVPRIQAPAGMVRIQATAGSGKTQLALRLLNDAVVAGQRALYVCFNRTLADHITHIAPAGARIASFHELCVDHWRSGGEEPGFTDPDIYRQLAERYAAGAATAAPRYDLLVIDEGQDFEPAWVGSLLPQLMDDGRLYLLEDDAQRLYPRDGFELEGAVTITCSDNFRSPRAIVDMINALGLSPRPVDARTPYDGELPTFRVYDDVATLRTATVAAVEALRERGIALDDIVVLCGRGHENSQLLAGDRLGAWTLRRFQRRYGADGEQVWSDGELLAETVHRFKGRSAAGVVLTEFDFAELDDGARQRLFVGLTRAHLAAEIVLSRRAEAAIAARLGG